MTTEKLGFFVGRIMEGARQTQQRSGQYLFNRLPNGIASMVGGTSFDPFHYDMTAHEIGTWIDRHLIFDGFEIIGLFHNDRLLWEAPKSDNVTFQDEDETPVESNRRYWIPDTGYNTPLTKENN